jgi:hypothetical protein
MTVVLRQALALALALGMVTPGCDVCGLIEQQVVVPADDPDLAPLIADCQTPASSTACPTVAGRPGAGDATCACLPLCKRVFAIVDPDPHPPSLQECRLVVDDKGLAHVTIEYRSVCQ